MVVHHIHDRRPARLSERRTVDVLAVGKNRRDGVLRVAQLFERELMNAHAAALLMALNAWHLTFETAKRETRVIVRSLPDGHSVVFFGLSRLCALECVRPNKARLLFER